MGTRNTGAIAFLAIACACGQSQDRPAATSEADAIGGGGTHTNLRRIVQGAPQLSLEAVELTVRPPSNGWQLGTGGFSAST